MTKATTKAIKEIRYCVIGGQYEHYCYGETATLQGAKVLATKNEEYWDNWQGWRKPSIYRIEDTVEVISHGLITRADGTKNRVPREDALPIVWRGGRWVDTRDDEI